MSTSDHLPARGVSRLCWLLAALSVVAALAGTAGTGGAGRRTVETVRGAAVTPVTLAIYLFAVAAAPVTRAQMTAPSER